MNSFIINNITNQIFIFITILTLAIVLIARYKKNKYGFLYNKWYALKLTDDYINDKKYFKNLDYYTSNKKIIFSTKKISNDVFKIDILTEDTGIRKVLRDRLEIENDSVIVSAERYKSIVEATTELFGTLQDSIRIKYILDTDRMRTKKSIS